jgi:hypothetical protein
MRDKRAGFQPFCGSCVLETKPDPIYGGPTIWMSCLCGSSGVVEEICLGKFFELGWDRAK